MKELKYIDLFAGIGGFRLGFSKACSNLGITSKCVFSSEIKPYAVKVYNENFDGKVSGDITKINSSEIPEFDVLLAGFPCQAFSSAGKRHGFNDTRGTMFFEVERILRDKQPKAFILENVDGLVKHDLEFKFDEVGRTLRVILEKLKELGYNVSWKVFDSTNFGLAQKRNRVYIVGTKSHCVNLDNFPIINKKLKDILEKGKPVLQNKLTALLLKHFSVEDLYGKSVKDKRGGKDNIHSWDISLKGKVTKKQKEILEWLLKARRRKDWAIKKGIEWMDGMPLTLSEIEGELQENNLKSCLDDLVFKGYLKYEHPKDIVVKTDNKGSSIKTREFRLDLEKGYNIVAGKLSFEINKILNPNEVSPTLVATDLDRVVVPDCDRIRCLTKVEQLRLFGYPDDFRMPVKDKESFDLFGNTVAIPVVEAIAERMIRTMKGEFFPTPEKDKKDQLEFAL